MASQRKVEHNYRDHASTGTEEENSKDDDGKTVLHASDRNFPVKLHFMLSDLEADGLGHIVSWQPHGRCFVVHKQEEFVKMILPMWFRQSKFASFQRQLNLYGFKRLTTGRDKNAYYHELFLRGKRFLSHKIPRCKLKGQGARKSTSPESEPNFYLLPYLAEEVQEKDRNPQSAAGAQYPPATYASSGSGLSLEQLVQPAAARPQLQQQQQKLATQGLYPAAYGYPSAVENSVLAAQWAYQQQQQQAMLPSVQMMGMGAGLGNGGLGNAGGLLPLQNTNLSSLLSSDMALRFALARGLCAGGSGGGHAQDGHLTMPQAGSNYGKMFPPV